MPVINEIKNLIPELKTVHFISDGPTTQYHNKTMFYLATTYLTKTLGVGKMFWHFSEAGHGKGAPDGVGGLKRSAGALVAVGKDLPNLETLVNELKEACKSNHIMSITDESILKIAKCIPADIPVFKGILNTHQISWCHDQASSVFVSRLSCLNCLSSCQHYGIGELKLKICNEGIFFLTYCFHS